MIQVVLLMAGPTPWDEEDRLVGGRSLPLAESAPAMIEAALAERSAPAALYTDRADEACEQAAQIAAHRFNLKVRDRADLAEMRLGLWEGLTRTELAERFPTVFERWEEQPLAVIPPQGETMEEAIERLRDALRQIVRRNRGTSILLALRPMAMQIAAGLLRGEDPATIGTHLQKVEALTTMDVDEGVLRR